ncbi:unnamed protein product [Staurois parvus]|uniref:Uncharacterized protein n=1 Tax=Staurois parvus TaxID=386267 RepID=A0ABN9E3T6_9NEOB|nr:unnamed protein product [Staurois parvus]
MAPLTVKCSAPLEVETGGAVPKEARVASGVAAWKCLMRWNPCVLQLQDEFLQRTRGSRRMGRVVNSQSQDQYGTADKSNVRIKPGSYTE